MSKKSAYLLGILLTIGVGTILYKYLCCNCCCDTSKTEAVVTSTIENLPKNVFDLNGKNINYHCNSSFNFLNGDFKSIQPINDSVNIGIINLKRALETSGQKITITGYALSTEVNSSAYENLGLARAVDVKNYFISKGIPANLIDTRGEIKDDLSQKDKTIFGTVNFAFTDLPVTTSKDDWNALKEKINANPLTLYFTTNQYRIDLSEADRQKVTDIVHYLDNVPDAKLYVVGHTDNVGSRDVNLRLGLGRAEFAKSYLINNGILADKINSTSKGPDTPIASNSNVEGRAKNRRTEIKIK